VARYRTWVAFIEAIVGANDAASAVSISDSFSSTLFLVPFSCRESLGASTRPRSEPLDFRHFPLNRRVRGASDPPKPRITICHVPDRRASDSPSATGLALHRDADTMPPRTCCEPMPTEQTGAITRMLRRIGAKATPWRRRYACLRGRTVPRPAKRRTLKR
jgi:hypothetical protein